MKCQQAQLVAAAARTPQVGGLETVWAVERQGLDTGDGHGNKGDSGHVHIYPNGNTRTLPIEPTSLSLDTTTSEKFLAITKRNRWPSSDDLTSQVEQ